MRALVLGASGQVGAALCARLGERGHAADGTHGRVPQAGTRFLDIADAAATERLIDEVTPDWVFCPAALTRVDYCEDHPEEAFLLNRDAPAVAARAAARRGAGFVFYSSEYVFDGTAGPYGEDDPVNPLSVYGRSKLEGERRALAENPRALVVRTTVAYGPEPQGKNFVYQLLRRARAGERMTVPADQRSSPTYNADLAAASVELAERGLSGVFHVAGPEILDRHAFARLACEVFGLDPGFLVAVRTAELGQRAPRPLRAGLRIDRARAVLGTPLRGPREGLEAMRRALG
ncbi:MAG: SDR family oxidoreductase [Candidatus Rokubacteria bacterium]|nr:SDR family oxidoreductase [Candidatus Rokubacteria bacterium]